MSRLHHAYTFSTTDIIQTVSNNHINSFHGKTSSSINFNSTHRHKKWPPSRGRRLTWGKDHDMRLRRSLLHQKIRHITSVKNWKRMCTYHICISLPAVLIRMTRYYRVESSCLSNVRVHDANAASTMTTMTISSSCVKPIFSALICSIAVILLLLLPPGFRHHSRAYAYTCIWLSCGMRWTSWRCPWGPPIILFPPRHSMFRHVQLFTDDVCASRSPPYTNTLSFSSRLFHASPLINNLLLFCLSSFFLCRSESSWRDIVSAERATLKHKCTIFSERKQGRMTDEVEEERAGVVMMMGVR